MNAITRLLTLFVCLSTPVVAQEMPADVHQSSLVPSAARYEILQSELAARWTFRFDRFTGHISQIVHDKEDTLSWEDMTVEGLPSVTAPSRPRFQLFLSGIAAKWMFILDTETGRSWQLQHTTTKNPDGSESESYVWSILPAH